ncbi:MAG: thrombospondin type 3 repeat-containing protein [Bdellovibrionales bacterium]|nr:thrombospondin type 3 repeat-containing protein [Bdellovibrionales bacterium]
MIRILVLTAIALVSLAFTPVAKFNPLSQFSSQSIQSQIEISEFAAVVTSAKQARKKLKKRLRRKKCSLARVGSETQQKRCVRKKLKRIDSDKDGIVKKKDNCLDVSNFDQANSDADSHGDACDNCPATTNEDQADVNVNGVGNACETDTDSSTV